MKKYFLSIVALAGMLFATSCQESLVEPQVDGTTTFSIEVPGQMGTKAIGDASIIDRLYVAVYENFDENGGTLPTSAIYKTNVPVSGGVATVALNLIQGQKYDIVFWAQNGESYVDADDELLSIPMTNTFHNDEEGAAFFHFERNFEPKGNAKDIKLRRPFAQLNLGTTQGSLSTNAGNYTLKSSTITVSTVAEEFNTITGVGVDQNLNPTTYQATIDFSQALTVGGKDYTYVSMDYLPIPSESKILVNIDAVIVIEDENQNTKTISHSFKSVPVQENYRTNIVGNLISSSTDFNVVVDAEFDGELPETDLEKLQFAAQNGGEVVLQGDVVLSESLVIAAGKEVIIDLNGHTISQEQSQTAAYSMIVNNGNLLIIDGAGTGVISYKDLGNGGPYVSNTILNNASLTIKGGHLQNNSVDAVATTGFPHVIDNNASLVIEGGVLTNSSNYSTIRIWCTTDDNTFVNIKGGTLNGCVDFQTVSASPNKGTLIISGGTFNPDAYTGCSTRLLGFGTDVDEMIAVITGGTFNGNIKLNNYTSGMFNSEVYSISGGKFINDPSEFVKDGYQALQGTDNYYLVGVKTADVFVETSADLADAVNNATDDIVIALTADVEGKIALVQKQGVNVTIDGQNKKYTGAIRIKNWGGEEDCSITIKNINFDGTGLSGEEGCIYTLVNESGSNYYATNVTIENCKFTGEGVAAIRQNQGGDKNWTIKNCTVDNTMHSFLQIANTYKSLKIENCKVYSKNGANLNNTANASFTGCEFDVQGYAVRVGVDGSNSTETKVFNFTDCTLKSANDDNDAVVIIRQNAQQATLNFVNTTLVGDPQISGAVDGKTTINGL